MSIISPQDVSPATPHGTTLPWHPADDSIANLVPAALSCVDYSGIKTFLDTLCASGIDDVAGHLLADPTRFVPARQTIRIVTANQYGIDLYEAGDLDRLRAGFTSTLANDHSTVHLRISLALWSGAKVASQTSPRFTLSGRRFFIRIRAKLMPGAEHDWSRLIMVSEDVTHEEETRLQLAESERYAQALFRLAPVSLWVEDFSGLKLRLDAARDAGVQDIEAHLAANPDFLQACAASIRVIDVNEQTVKLYKASSRQALLANFDKISTSAAHGALIIELTNLWEGKLRFSCEFSNLTLGNDRLDMMMELSVLPGHEHDWSLVLIAETDFTDRRMIERQLEHISQHDSLTGLYNRFYYNKMIEALRHNGPFPLSLIIADLNGLKPVNDRFGHDAGDELLRRAADLLQQAAAERGIAVRMGGDEFLLLLPGVDAETSAQIMSQISQQLRDQTDDIPLTLSLGAATCYTGAGIDAMYREADQSMYTAKRKHYAKV